MSLGAHLDEMVLLYTVERRPIRHIADRFGATALEVKGLLLGAGVDLDAGGRVRTVGAPRSTRYRPREPSSVFTYEPPRRPAPAVVHEPGDLIDKEDRRHVRAVIKALGGKGFPFLIFRRAA